MYAILLIRFIFLNKTNTHGKLTIFIYPLPPKTGGDSTLKIAA